MDRSKLPFFRIVKHRPKLGDRHLMQMFEIAISPTSCLWPHDNYYISPTRVSRTSPLPDFAFRTRFSYKRFKNHEIPFLNPDSSESITSPSTPPGSSSSSSVSCHSAVSSSRTSSSTPPSKPTHHIETIDFEMGNLCLNSTPLTTIDEFDQLVSFLEEAELGTPRKTPANRGEASGSSPETSGTREVSARSKKQIVDHLSTIREELHEKHETADEEEGEQEKSLSLPDEPSSTSSAKSHEIGPTPRRRIIKQRIQVRKRKLVSKFQEEEDDDEDAEPKATNSPAERLSYDSDKSTSDKERKTENEPKSIASDESWSSHDCRRHSSIKIRRSQMRLTIRESVPPPATATTSSVDKSYDTSRRESLDKSSQTFKIDVATQTEKKRKDVIE